jgi:hypothetical protein
MPSAGKAARQLAAHPDLALVVPAQQLRVGLLSPEFIRTREAYLRLASVHFPKVEGYLRHDVLCIPYTHLITRCSV